MARFMRTASMMAGAMGAGVALGSSVDMTEPSMREALDRIVRTTFTGADRANHLTALFDRLTLTQVARWIHVFGKNTLFFLLFMYLFKVVPSARATSVTVAPGDCNVQLRSGRFWGCLGLSPSGHFRVQSRSVDNPYVYNTDFTHIVEYDRENVTLRSVPVTLASAMITTRNYFFQPDPEVDDPEADQVRVTEWEAQIPYSQLLVGNYSGSDALRLRWSFFAERVQQEYEDEERYLSVNENRLKFDVVFGNATYWDFWSPENSLSMHWNVSGNATHIGELRVEHVPLTNRSEYLSLIPKDKSFARNSFTLEFPRYAVYSDDRCNVTRRTNVTFERFEANATARVSVWARGEDFYINNNQRHKVTLRAYDPFAFNTKLFPWSAIVAALIILLDIALIAGIIIFIRRGERRRLEEEKQQELQRTKERRGLRYSLVVDTARAGE